MLGHRAHGASREPAPVALRIDPVAEIRASERAPDDVRYGDDPCKLAFVEDRELQPVRVAGDLGLGLEREELVRPDRVERRP
jgi:hypothetical protein